MRLAGYVTATLMIFVKQSNDRWAAVESMSNRNLIVVVTTAYKYIIIVTILWDWRWRCCCCCCCCCFCSSAMLGNNILESSTVTSSPSSVSILKKNLHYDSYLRAVYHLAAYHAACLHRLTRNIRLSPHALTISLPLPSLLPSTFFQGNLWIKSIVCTCSSSRFQRTTDIL